MTFDCPALGIRDFMSRRQTRLLTPRRTHVAGEIKARQTAKIKEIGVALASLGFTGLDFQAKALGLSRSTTWTILHANHKSSGLSAKVINRMLAAPNLPALVRTKILEYAEEKVAGRYGHSNVARNKFATALSVDLIQKKASISDGKSLPRNARARQEKRNTRQTDGEPDRKRLRLGQRATS
jgi:hypothetical protein